MAVPPIVSIRKYHCVKKPFTLANLKGGQHEICHSRELIGLRQTTERHQHAGLASTSPAVGVRQRIQQQSNWLMLKIRQSKHTSAEPRYSWYSLQQRVLTASITCTAKHNWLNAQVDLWKRVELSIHNQHMQATCARNMLITQPCI
jgi:hypothetical protein